MTKRRPPLALGVAVFVLGVCGWTKLEEPSDLGYTLLFTISGLLLLFLYFRAELRRKESRRVGIPIVCICLFFGGMGLSDIGKDPFGVALGVGTAAPLLLDILLRLRSRKYPEPQETRASQLRNNTNPQPQPKYEPKPEPRPVKICPHCGAPGRGDTCEYCGGPI